MTFLMKEMYLVFEFKGDKAPGISLDLLSFSHVEKY